MLVLSLTSREAPGGSDSNTKNEPKPREKLNFDTPKAFFFNLIVYFAFVVGLDNSLINSLINRHYEDISFFLFGISRDSP